jgi:hypothetical protein
MAVVGVLLAREWGSQARGLHDVGVSDIEEENDRTPGGRGVLTDAYGSTARLESWVSVARVPYRA